MKKLKQISALLLALIVLTLSLPVVSASNAYSGRRGRNILSEMINGSNLVKIYDRLVEECAVLDNKVDLPDGITITINELYNVYNLFYADYPEYFWIRKGTPGYWGYDDIVTAIIPIYDESVTASNIEAMKTQFDNKVNQLTSDLGGKSDYDKSKILHDRLCDTTEYVYGSHNQCAYGALVEGEAVCNGYARAYQHMLTKVGIEAWYVSGDSYNPISGDKVAHAWNVVKIDDYYYYTDVTWDDQGDRLFYAFFNITEKQLKEGHIIGDFEEYMPVAASTDANYFVKNDLVFSIFNKEKITNLLKENNGVIQVYVDGSMDVFKSRFESNIQSIATELGVVGSYSYSEATLGNAIILKINGNFACNHKYDNSCDTICNLCGDVRSITHTYSNACDAICNVCSATRTPAAHKYDNNKDTTCNVCGDVREIFEAAESWEISPIKTGVYNITPSKTLSGFSKDNLIVLDKQEKEVKYNDSKKGWPLTNGQKYTVKFNKAFSNTNNLSWKLTEKSNSIFTDVPSGEWYNDAVTYSVGRGIISGYGGTTKFGPGDNIQRQDFLVILARLDGVDLTSYGNKKSAFPDVPEGSYYEAAVNWGSEKGIVSGYANGKFGTGDKITREQLVTFLYRYANYKGIDTNYTSSEKNNVKSTYSDFKNVTDYAVNPVIWAISDGVISGKGGNKIAPSGNALRCEVAQIMYNIFKTDVL